MNINKAKIVYQYFDYANVNGVRYYGKYVFNAKAQAYDFIAYGKCTPLASNIVNVTRTYLECKQVDEDTNRMEIHASFLDMYF